MYVWLPISNIYEERALRRRGREGQPERILCYASIEKWADLESAEGGRVERGWAGSIHVEFAFSIFSAWAKAPAQQPASQSATPPHARRGMGLPGFKSAKKGFWNSQSMLVNLHSFFRNLGQGSLALFSLPSSLCTTDRAGYISGNHFCHVSRRRRHHHSTYENKEQLENAGKARVRGRESVEKIGRQFPFTFLSCLCRYRDAACFALISLVVVVIIVC